MKSSVSRNMIRKYFEAFPYKHFSFSADGKQIFFFEEGPGRLTLKTIRTADHNTQLNLNQAETVIDHNFAGHSFWSPLYSSAQNKIIVMMDAANEENYNLFVIDLTKPLSERKLLKRTHLTKTLSPSLSIDENHVLFLSRENSEMKGEFHTSFCKLDLLSGDVTTFGSDKEWDYKLNYCSPLEYGETILAFLDYHRQRKKLQLFEINIKTWEKRPLLSESMICSANYFVYPVLDNKVYFQSNISNFENIYELNLKNLELSKKTALEEKNSSGLFLLNGRPTLYICTEDAKRGISKVRLETLDQEILFESESEGDIQFYPQRNSLWMKQSSMRNGSRFARLSPSPKASFEACSGSLDSLLHCGERESLEYPSFDNLKIPGFLFLPKVPIRGAVIIAFYGGTDSYSSRYQMFLEQGLAVLSPAVRGSWGQSKDWQELIRGDLGGNEILDVIWGARFLCERLDLPEKNVIVEGGSHGGYAALRTMTFPNPFNGHDTSFKFAGGICWAGFADLIKFYENSWISDWLVDFLGPFDKTKYQDRSPVSHLEKLRGPLFICHGKNDIRVPISTMTDFIEKLPQTPFTHKVHIQDGEGHASSNIEADTDHYDQMFETLWSWLGGREHVTIL